MIMKSDEVIDYYISGKYRSKPKIKEWINATGTCLTDLSAVYSQMTYNIDNAFGDLLDAIGAIVGARRILIPKNILFFGYEDTPDAAGYGVAPYYNWKEPYLISLPDEYYRYVLKAKVLYNQTNGTRLDLIRATKLLLQVDIVNIIDYEDMRFEIGLSESVEPVVIDVLNYYKMVIRPAGVDFLGYTQNIPLETKFFGYQDTLNAVGYGVAPYFDFGVKENTKWLQLKL